MIKMSEKAALGLANPGSLVGTYSFMYKSFVVSGYDLIINLFYNINLHLFKRFMKNA